MIVLYLNVCRLCVPNIMSLGICYKKIAPRQSWCVLLDTMSKLRYFRSPVWKSIRWQNSKPTWKL